VLLTRVIKNALGRRGLAGVYVGDDSDVADVTERRRAGHCKVPLISGGWIGESPVQGDFQAANGSEKREALLDRVQVRPSNGKIQLLQLVMPG
jgi:hypothetical protein